MYIFPAIVVQPKLTGILGVADVKMSKGDFYLTPNAPDPVFGNIIRFKITVNGDDLVFYIQAYENDQWVNKKLVQLV